MIFNKISSCLAIGALLLASWGAAGGSAAENDLSQSPQKEMPNQAPPPGTYKVDPVHSFVHFGARHHMVGLVRGRFDKVTGTITVSKDLAACAVDVAIDAYSINTQYSERDDDLRSPDFFDVIKFPIITYRGRGVHRIEGNSWRIDGSLSIRNIAKVVPVTFVFKGSFPDVPPNKPTRVAFHGTAGTKRGDFGMTRDNPLELGASPPPGSDVEIEIDVEADATSSGK